MRRSLAVSLALLVALISTGSVLAHHSLAHFNTTKAVRAKGTVVRFHVINPHSILYVEEKTADGQTRRWAAEGPGVLRLRRRSIGEDFVKPGDVVEICGYLHKENVIWQVATPSPDPKAVSLSGTLITAELLVTPDGKTHEWEDYGHHHCYPPGFRDHHSR
jgi:hypothetical protein